MSLPVLLDGFEARQLVAIDGLASIGDVPQRLRKPRCVRKGYGLRLMRGFERERW